MSIENSVTSVLSTLLKKDFSDGEEISMAQQEGWDSMKHIEIIMTIEEEFDVSFDPADIPTLISVEKIVEAIERNGK